MIYSRWSGDCRVESNEVTKGGSGGQEWSDGFGHVLFFNALLVEVIQDLLDGFFACPAVLRMKPSEALPAIARLISASLLWS
jgi:hypothetical protein